MKKNGFTLIETLAYTSGCILLTSVFINFIIFAFKFYNDEIKYSKQVSSADNCIMYIRKISNDTLRVIASNDSLVYKSKNGKDNIIYYEMKNKSLIDDMQDNRKHILLRNVEGFKAIEKGELIIVTIKLNENKERSLCIRKKKEMS